MSRHLARRLVAVAAIGSSLAAVALPASAEGVAVSLTDAPGSRQFAVQDISGNPLTAINLGTGGVQPFRTTVTDSAFKNLTSGYSVSAKMNNLYLQVGGNPDFTQKVASKDVSLQYGTSPLSALGVAFPVLPRLTVSGTLRSCANLDSATKTVLGLSPLGAVLDLTNTALLNLCTALLAADALPVTATVSSTTQEVTSAVTSALALADLPAALTGATPGAFTNADYSAGTAGAGDPAAVGAPAATSLGIMTGTPGMSTALQTLLTSTVTTALNGLPLTSATDPAKTGISGLLTVLSGSTTTAVASVGTALSVLDATKQSAVLNTLTGLAVVPPALTDLLALSGQYYGFPVLKATPTTPVAGTYKGTMTVTFVQQ